MVPHEENSNSKEQTYKDKVAEKIEKILSFGRGKRKKRSRDDIFLPTTLEIMQRHQQEADEHFLKMEEARRQQELEVEEKQRREDRQHEIFIMQIMENMFMHVASCLNQAQG